ncbi:MAG: cytochrome c-type biogenesis protein CcmH [Myxococcales bacterium]|nr:cytochrome c-type biogenesis protein CcmH [Myxococcales bacterium]
MTRAEVKRPRPDWRLLAPILCALTVVGPAWAGPDVATGSETVAATDPGLVVGPPEGPPLTGDLLAEATRVVASQLRCPVCQGLSVADSPSESAVAMKHEVERLVAMGYSTEQCLLYFESSYGEFIRLEPKAEGLNLLVWAAPAGLLVVGLGIVGWMRISNRPKAEPVKAIAIAVPEGLQPYVDRVHAAVGASAPGPVSPGGP